jgi:ABC-type uncharacterized transport system involved in gliding motility auxiliary subunit
MTTNATRSGPGGKRVRARQRAAHLVTGFIVLVAVYAGPLLGGAFTAVVQWVVLPVLVLTGVALWQWPRVRRVLRGRAAAVAR